MNDKVNASRTLAQAGAWLLDQDSTGRMWLRGPGHLDGVDLPKGTSIECTHNIATVTTPDTTIEIEVPARQEKQLNKLVGLINCPPNPARIRMTSTTTPMTPAVPLGSSMLVCPHCQTRGKVSTRQIRVKRGVSGGKATGAVLTGGWSLLATGLARKESVTQANCAACGSTWQF
jgi:hypothetical protein